MMHPASAATVADDPDAVDISAVHLIFQQQSCNTHIESADTSR